MTNARKTTVHPVEIGAATPFDPDAARRLMAALSANLPLADHLRPIGAITVDHAQAATYEMQTPRREHGIRGWVRAHTAFGAAIITGLIIGAIATVATLHTLPARDLPARDVVTASVAVDEPSDGLP